MRSIRSVAWFVRWSVVRKQICFICIHSISLLPNTTWLILPCIQPHEGTNRNAIFCFHQALKQQHGSVRHEGMEVLGFGVRRCRHLTIDGAATTSATPNGSQSGGSASRTTPWTSFRGKTFALFEVNRWTLYWNQMVQFNASLAHMHTNSICLTFLDNRSHL